MNRQQSGPAQEQGEGPPGKHQRKERVTNHDRTALVGSIARALVIKGEDLFFLSQRDGEVPLGGKHGLGLYYHDCRFLNGYEVRLGQARPEQLAATASLGFEARLVLTNPDLTLEDGSLFQKEDLSLQWERIIDAKGPALCDRLSWCNHRPTPVTLPVSLTFTSTFEALFNVRGMPRKKRGTLHRPRWQGDVLTLAYDGSDGVHRALAIRFSPAPQHTEGGSATFQFHLQSQQPQQLLVTLTVSEKDSATAPPEPPAAVDYDALSTSRARSTQEWLGQQTQVHSDSRQLERVIDRSIRDLYTLRTTLHGRDFFAAGAPWYVTLFGRDSLIASLQTLAYEPEMAASTLRLLAEYQGKKVDAWRDEAPGKIMHELRVGEMARTNQVPQTPYYGSIDATPLFLVLLCRHAAWTGRLDLFHELRKNVEAALKWMATYGAPDGAGYLAYEGQSKNGLGNQGWKDSGDAIVNADGSLATPPIALAEVQGYAYLAKKGLADLYDRAGEPDFASRLRKEADDLRQRFNRDFWLEDEGTYALALQKDGKPAAVAASNAGQVLWAGIAEDDKAERVARRLMQDDLFSGWGVRTLSSREKRYNPVGYHLGTVWPHDNSLIAMGLRNYGQDEAARRIFEGIFAAATAFDNGRLPEVFAGYERSRYGIPVHYPVACHPQAWAAGAMPYLLQALLGLVPEGFERRLRVARPVLPAEVDHVELHGLRVAGARVSLRFERAGASGRAQVKVLQVEGALDVHEEEAPEGQPRKQPS